MKERSKEKGRGGGRNPRNRYARTGERMGGARAGFRLGMAKKKTRELGSMRAGKRKRLVRKRGWGRTRRARRGEEDDEENGEREKLEELAALFFFLRGRCTLRRARETIATLLAPYGRIRFLMCEFWI